MHGSVSSLLRENLRKDSHVRGTSSKREQYLRGTRTPKFSEYSAGENTRKGSCMRGTRPRREHSYQLSQRTDRKSGSRLLEGSDLGFLPTVQHW